MNEYSFFEHRDLENRIRGLYDEQLVDMMRNPEAYVSEAVAIARDEIEKRGGLEQLVQYRGQEVQESEKEAVNRERDLHIILVKVLSTIPALLIMVFFLAMVLSTVETATEKNHLEMNDVPDWVKSCAKIVSPLLLLPVLWFIWRIVTNQLLKVFPPKC